MKLHVGCGLKYLEGYRHVDIMPYDHIDFQTSAEDLHMIEDGSVDEIYACHILEHFKRFEIDSVLREWARVLKLGGLLRVAVPDFQSIVMEYIDNGGGFPR